MLALFRIVELSSGSITIDGYVTDCIFDTIEYLTCITCTGLIYQRWD